MLDLGFRGPKYTWNNGRGDAEFTNERLDRVVANGDRCELHHEIEVVVGVTLCLNHLPIFVSMKGQFFKQKQPWKFKYEAGWDLLAKCREFVANSWELDRTNDIDPWHQLGARWTSAGGY